ncbi:MAG: hypothetical protein FJ398_10270 [Verrucomicrobia bacterium]|nr:hypothetical protein [Verrucomicrobiota bacterium]
MWLEMFKEVWDGTELPHKRLSLRTCLIVEQAIVRAWRWMIENPQPSFDLDTAEENGVTHRLHETLFDVVFKNELVDGFNKDVFTVGARGTELRNFDGRKRDLKPDLIVGFINRPSVAYPTQDWLFIECKPVDVDLTVGAHYCDKGLIRFVRGDYAWAMQSAMMIGYAREGYSLIPKLSEALASHRKEPIPTSFGPESCPRTRATPFAEPTAISKHQRTFSYIENNLPAGVVVIRHLWLKRG